MFTEDKTKEVGIVPETQKIMQYSFRGKMLHINLKFLQKKLVKIM